MKWLVISILVAIPALASSQTILTRDQAYQCNSKSIELEMSVKNINDIVDNAHSISSEVDTFIVENGVTTETSSKISELYSTLGELWGNIYLLSRALDEGRKDITDTCFNIRVETTLLDEVCRDSDTEWCRSFNK